MEHEGDSGEPICEHADSNPKCPYVVQMKQQKEDIEIIKNALVGDDMQSGIVKRVSDIENALKVQKAETTNKKRAWSPKEWGTLLAGIAALLTALAAYLNSIPH